MKNILFSIFIISLISCSKEKEESEISSGPNKEYEIWSGPNIEFKKEVGDDPKDKLNQDEITSSVSLTRGTNGEIYNVVLEEKAQKGVSPLGTQWAIGSIDNISNLSFSSFRNAVGSPQNVVGKSLVLHIIDQDVYLSVEFTDWGQSQKGNFTYIRSTKK